MATHISSGTTTGGAVTTVTFANWYRGIEIVNRSSGDMWARVDNVDPTISGDDCVFIAALSSVTLDNQLLPPEVAIGRTGNTVVKLITAANATYSVQAGV